MNKKKLLLLLLFICFNLNQVIAFEILKKETLFGKVSFALYQLQKDSIYKKEYLNIEELYNKKEYGLALKKALPFLKLDLEDEINFKISFLIAEIYRKNNNHKKAVAYFRRGVKLLKFQDKNINEFQNKGSKEVDFIRSYLMLGNEYLRKKSKDSILTKRYKDSAKYFYSKSLEIITLNEKSSSYQASASANLSGIYLKDSLYDLAKEYAINAVKIHKKRNNKISEAAAKGNLANIFLAQNNYKEAKKTYKEALSLIKNLKSDRSERIKETLYENLAFNLYKLKDYEAYAFQELSYKIKDSLRDKEVRKIIEELGFKHNFDSKKGLFEQQKEMQLLQERDKVRSIALVGIVLFILLLATLGYYFFRQKNLELKLTQSELLQNQNLDILKSETQARVLDATLNGREAERKEIAETLHDNVSALLSSANLHLQATKKQFNGNLPIEILKSQEIITEASQKIRDLSHTLVSSVLLKFGLNFAVKDIAEKYSNSEININAEIDGLRRYNQKFEIKTYNIIQELVNNILKHSKATNAFINLKEIDEELVIQISDDGVGFNKSKITIKDGLGINQIEARIHMMKGNFKINSRVGRGTQIKVILPVQEKEEVNLF